MLIRYCFMNREARKERQEKPLNLCDLRVLGGKNSSFNYRL